MINKVDKEGIKNMLLDKIDYTVERIDGDYAYLKNDADETAELKCVARALLPAEIVEGSKLIYEMMEYSMQNP